MKKLEVCCADIESVWAAKEGGAHRIELCEALELDGLTPSEELIRQAIATGMPVQEKCLARFSLPIHCNDHREAFSVLH